MSFQACLNFLKAWSRSSLTCRNSASIATGPRAADTLASSCRRVFLTRNLVSNVSFRVFSASSSSIRRVRRAISSSAICVACANLSCKRARVFATAASYVPGSDCQLPLGMKWQDTELAPRREVRCTLIEIDPENSSWGQLQVKS